MKIPEEVWRNAERMLARKERQRLIRLGRIVPASRMRPLMLEQDDDGRWTFETGVSRAS